VLRSEKFSVELQWFSFGTFIFRVGDKYVKIIPEPDINNRLTEMA